MLLLACASPSTGPLPWDPDVGTAAVPDVDGDAVAATIAAAAGAVRASSAGPLFEAYAAVRGGFEPDCPSTVVTDEAERWSGDCTTQAGVTYTGSAFWNDFDGWENGGIAWDGQTVQCLGDVDGLQGASFGCHGSAWQLEGDDAGTHVWTSSIAGLFAWDGASAAGTWLEDADVPNLSIEARRAADGSTSLAVSGGLVVDGEDVSFDAFAVDGSATGTVSVRVDGTWVDAAFDGDGCGALTTMGTSVGEACPDLSALVDWEDAPW